MREIMSTLTLAIALLTNLSCHRSNATPVHKDLDPVFLSADPRAVYAADLNDSWNRIFRSLFTRTDKIYVSSDFAEGAPFVSFTEAMAVANLKISRSTLDRTEIGDRAIDPLYPSFFTDKGHNKIMTDSAFAELKQALTEALNESNTRPPIARALMQSDLWAAYDAVFRFRLKGERTHEVPSRNEQLLSLLYQLIKKLALTSQEIASLRSNFVDTVQTKQLPDLFTSRSEWIEIEFFAHRLHDDSANFRRAARVFVKPRKAPADRAAFVESLKHYEHLEEVEAVGLVVQNLLLNKRGEIVPSPLISDVQFRFFKDNNGQRPVDAEAKQFELSRHLLLTQPATGGFIEFNEKSPGYLAAAGNDYSFMSPLLHGVEAPIMVPLRRRCAQCHGPSLLTMMTYSIQDIPPVPTAKVLNAADNERARYVAAKKAEREDYKRLVSDWN
jgi:hypothetical protein